MKNFFNFIADWLAGGGDKTAGQNPGITHMNKSLENFDTIFLMEKLHFLNFL